MFTFQDYQAATNGAAFNNTALNKLITEHRCSALYMGALDANRYDAGHNTTIQNYTRWLYNSNGEKIRDKTSSNNRLCSGFFRRLNTQRMTYSLGNGVTFEGDTKEKLGQDFDTKLRTAGYYALIHGVSFVFFNVDHIHVFPVTEFAPLWDEETGALMAGLRYWQIDPDKPVQAVLYEIDGFTRLKGDKNANNFKIVEEKRPYRYKTEQAPADEEPEIVGAENYSSLPVIPVWGNRNKQSTLEIIKGQIDAYDLIQSGYANDLTDCSEIYWIVSNAGGMDDEDLAKFRDRLKLHHIANVDNADGVGVTPYTQEIPKEAREAFLDRIRATIYETFGGLDVHTVAAGATNDHIEAAYQPLDEEADDFEYQMIEAVQAILALIGIEETPVFKRNRISNQKEMTDMVLAAATYLDEQTVLEKLPFITPDEVQEIMARKDAEQGGKFEDDTTADLAAITEALTAQKAQEGTAISQGGEIPTGDNNGAV